jgi:hypothetical protein
MRKVLFVWCLAISFLLPFDFNLGRIGIKIPGIATFLVITVCFGLLLWEILIITEKKINPIHVLSIDILILILFSGYIFSSIRISPIRIWSLKYTLRLFGFSFIYYAILNFASNKKQLSSLAFALTTGTAAAALLSLIQTGLPDNTIIAIQKFFENADPKPAQTNGPFISVYPLTLFIICLLPLGIVQTIESYINKHWARFIACFSIITVMLACLINLIIRNGIIEIIINPKVRYIELWKKTFNLFIRHPFKGIGVDIFACPFLKIPYSTIRAHNQFLEILNSVGILGLITFCCLIAASLKLMITGLKTKTPFENNFYLRIAAATGLILFIILSMFNDYLAKHETIAIFWVLLGLGIKASLLDADTKNARS